MGIYKYGVTDIEKSLADAKQLPLLARRLNKETTQKWLKWILIALLPTYFHGWIPNNRVKPSKGRQLRKTAFLDGLRGVAALIVVVHHQIASFDWPRYYQEPYSASGPYPSGVDPRRYTSWVQLPIVRVLYSGRAMIAIFFVISGYVLSFRQIQMIRSSSYDQLSDSLFSSTFRRPFRLFIPSIFGVALYYISIDWGWQSAWLGSGNSRQPKRFGRYTGFIDGVSTLFKSAWYLDRAPAEIKDQIRQLWTIPIEFAGSMIIFIILSGTSRLPTWLRISVIVGLMTNSLFSGFWGIFIFLGGMMIAEFEEIFENIEEPDSIKKLRPLRSALYYIFWSSNLIVGLVIAGYPHFDIGNDPLLSPLLKITPQWYRKSGGLQIHYFWASVASIQIVWSLFRLPLLQKIFTTRIALYLGDISYALYIVHYHITLPMAIWMHRKANWIFGEDRGSHLKQFFVIWLELLPVFFVCIWEADLFLRYIDKPSVNFAKWLEAKVRSWK